MKVIFVGLHNKPGKMPLCSSTKSGKLIDRVIEESGITDWQKTNLFDLDYLPLWDDQYAMAAEWFDRIDPQPGDTIILLGNQVRDAMLRCEGYTIIKVAHPAHERSHEQMKTYVNNVAAKIKEALATTGLPEHLK